VRIVCVLLQLYSFVLLARVILSWVPQVPEGIRPLANAVYSLTEPVLRFARPLLPPLRIGGFALDLRSS
jgi:YggT family protein